MNFEIVTNILFQLGGNKFMAMTGAKHLAGFDNGLQFSLPGNGFCKRGINKVQVLLDATDTYTVVFGKIRKHEYKEISRFSDIYAEDLQTLFTRETGLETHL